MIRLNARLAAMLLMAGLVAATCTTVFEARVLGADDTVADEPQAESREFRRVFVPADSPEEWPVGNQRFLPLSEAEFSKLVGSGPEVSKRRGPAQVRVKAARYRADLQAVDQLRVSAELDIELLDKQPKLLPISEFSFPILASVWKDSATKPAVMGLWQEDGSSTAAVLVEHSSTLTFEGLIPATVSNSNRREFAFKTPAIVPQILELQVPANHAVEITHAELLSKESGSLGESRWTYQLSPQGSHLVRVTPQIPSPTGQEFPFVSQTTSYRIESTGLEMQTDLRLDSSNSTNTALEVALPGGARVVDVAVDQEEVDWKVEYQQGRQVLVVNRPRSSTPQTIRIHALSRVRLGTDWELPKLRPREVKWTEGTVRLLVSPDLQLQSISPNHCLIQHVLGLDEDANEEEVYRLQEWSSTASIVLRVSRPKPKLRLETLTEIELASSDAKAKLYANFTNSQGKVYQVRAVIAPEWEVESVNSTSGSALREWHVDRTDSSSTLYCQLEDSVSREQPLWLEIEARNASDQIKLPTSVGRLKVMRFLDAECNQELLSIRSSKPQELVPTIRQEDQLGGLDRYIAKLPTHFVEAVTPSRAASYIDVSSLSDATRVEVGRQAVQYSAKVSVEAEALSDSLRHTYQLDFLVEAGGLSEVLLETSLPLPEGMRWMIEGSRVEVACDRVLDAKLAEPIEPSRTQYLLRFSELMATDFQLRAEYSQPAKAREEVNLLQLPQTLRWEGRAFVRGPLEGIAILDQGLVPSLSTQPIENATRMPVLGAYRLGPEDFRRDSRPLALRLERRLGEGELPRLVAWSADYQTVQSANGAALHAASFHLESSGTRLATVRLPAGAKLLEVWHNNQQIDLNAVVNAEGGIKLNLGNEEIWHQIDLRYATTGLALEGSARIQPILPDCSFPVHLSRWTLWAPAQYEIDSSQLSYSSQDYHWWKRVFGPLARSRQEGVFNPGSRRRWSELWNAPLTIQDSKQQAGTLASRLADQMHRESARSFGEVLSEVINANGLQDRVRIDRSAMLAKELHPEVLCRSLTRYEPTGPSDLAVTRPLASYDLSLIISPSAIVLTTPERIAHWSDRLRQTRVPGLYLSTSDSLSDNLAKLKRTASPDFISVADWRQLSFRGTSRRDANILSDLVDVGRQAQTVEFSSELPSLIVRQAYVQRALWYAVLLLTLVLGVWQLAHYPNAMILIGAIAGSVCLIAPISWLTIPQAVFLGLVAAALIRVIAKSGELVDRGRTATHPMVLSLVTMFVLIGSFQGELIAQEPNREETQASKPRDLPKVLIPIDFGGKQKGDDVYVSESFLASLRKFEAKTQPDAEAVVLAAHYDAVLPQREEAVATGGAFLASDLWTIRLKVETRRPNQTLSLPFRPAEAEWLQEEHRLDGLPVELQWRKAGGCSLVVQQPGIHWLHLFCRPRYTLNDGSALLRLHVPQVPGARLSLAANASEQSEISVAGAELPSNSSTENLREFELGSAETLELRWQSASPADSGMLWERIEKCCWLSVNPSSATLDVQFRIVGNRGTLPTLSLDFSNQLQLLAPEQDSPVSKILASESSRTGRVQLELKSNLPEEFVIPLKFEFKRRIGLGQIYFPEVRLAGTTPSLHRFAVSVASGLSYDERGSNGLRTLEPTEFLDAWKGSVSAPLFAYAIDRQLPRWSLRVWPDPRSLRTQQAMRVECGLNRVNVETTIDVEELTGAWHVHKLRVPESFEVDEISVREQPAGKLVASRWSRSTSSEIAIILGRPLTGTHSVTLRGYLRTALGQAMEIPRFGLVGSRRGQVLLDLYRSEFVQMDWLDPQSIPPSASMNRPAISNRAIPVGNFVWRESVTNQFSKFSIRKNEVSFSTLSATSLERDSAGWSVRLRSRIQVQQGILNRLKIDLPNNVRPPYRLQSKQSAVIQEVVDSEVGKQLTVLLTKPASRGEEFEIQLSGGLNLPVDRRLVVPSLRWSGATRNARYVQLPTLVAGESITWQRSGLRREDLPPPLAEPAMASDPVLCFRVEQKEFKAEQRNSQRTMRNARVRHAKISGFLDADGELVAVAEFFIQLGRATSCDLQLPKGAEVFQLVVGDRPARRERRADGSWRLPVGPPFLPQRVLVGYRCSTKRSGNQVLVQPPRVLLGDQVLPVPKTWWQVRAPVNLMLGASGNTQSVHARELAEKNYHVPLQIVEEAFSQVLELSPNVGRVWANTWQGIIQAAEQRWQNYRSDRNSMSEMAVAAETLLAMEDAFADEERFGQSGEARLNYPVPVRESLGVVANRKEYCFLGEGGSPLMLTRTFGSQQSPWQWLAALVLVGAVSAVVIKLRRHPECYHDLCHWPHSLAMLAGLAWWLLLSPSALGLLVIGLALFSLTLRKWRSYQNDQSASLTTRVFSPSS